MPYVEVNNVNLYYQVSGEGIPIIFIHPPLLSSANFYYQQQELSEKFKVITFDMRGHGKSDSGKEKFTYPLIVKDIVAILKHLQIKNAFIAGYSTGAAIALEAMRNHQELFCGGILMSPMISPTSFYIKSLIQLASLLSNKTTFSLLAMAICNGNADLPSTYERLNNEAHKGDYQKIKEYYQYSSTFNFIDCLTAIVQPNLLLYGGNDSNFIKTKQIVSEKLPNSLIKIIKNVSHQIPTKAAKSVNTSITNFILDQT
jgi:pimeloyl-ACP methyl ester carboxylesterase